MTPNPCKQARTLMPAAALGDLDPSQRVRLDQHLASCPGCASEMAAYTRLDQLLAAQPAIELVPPPVTLPGLRPAAVTRMESPVGPLLVAVSNGAVCEVVFADFDGEAGFDRELRSRGFAPRPDPEVAAPVVRELEEYFAGARSRFDIRFDLSGVTPFTRSVLEATAAVPYGRLSTYADIARQIGKPGASRAVGNALGRNPIPVIVPCHRIVKSDAGIGGYTGGLDIKRTLLRLEGTMLA